MIPKKILYVGRFELPDKEATANRVVANAKLLRDFGCEVILAGWSEKVTRTEKWKKSEYYGFTCYEKHKATTVREKFEMFVDASPELSLLSKGGFELLIAYDFPAIALKKLMRCCRRCGIACICDVSEWYTNSNKHFLFRMVRAYDSHLRMKVLHKKADGLIVISKYLEDYYSACKTVRIPPLVDKEDPKWAALLPDSGTRQKVRLVYAGWPSKTKERLDLLVEKMKNFTQIAELHVYGIDETKYRAIYGDEQTISYNVVFHGRTSHLETLHAVKNADYSLIIRESNRKNNAGFPSKLVESISCGTPVLTTPISNVTDYVHDGINGYIISAWNLESDMKHAFEHRKEVCVNQDLFDYRRYSEPVRNFLEHLREQ